MDTNYSKLLKLNATLYRILGNFDFIFNAIEVYVKLYNHLRSFIENSSNNSHVVGGGNIL